jgi:sulfatase modifying factor 1
VHWSCPCNFSDNRGSSGGLRDLEDHAYTSGNGICRDLRDRGRCRCCHGGKHGISRELVMSRILRHLLAMGAMGATVALGACILDFEHLTGGCLGAACDGGPSDGARVSGEAATTDGSTPDGESGCPSLHGPRPVLVTASAGSFCIDSTEVTAGQYAEFIKAKGSDTSDQPPECVWNTSFASLVDPSTLPPGNAIGGVDWCDALAFCKWSGKTLCGGFDGASVPVSSANDASKSVWFAACTGDGKRVYPYGDTFDQAACNDFDRTAAPAAVGASPGCLGGFPDLVDLVGNVEEWTASCDNASNPATAGCLARGGQYGSRSPDEVACATTSVHQEFRNSAESWRGFRCCSRR